ncbi:thiamine phosphate synthase [uncultured Intestinimonas sp.]|uniref:thiamine phosphate synthase n=1 Tax=uncultured Intestinimonas sp. TaxID=1689265 RepID=UPI0025F7B8A4|nr:thiamine phosphate synthase [uncultured Intestinimonas sp.]
MKLSPSDLRLYAITDRRALPAGVTLAQAVVAALDGGVTCLQLREKTASAGEILALARTLLPLCRARRVPLLINDRVDIALAAGADGVHLGQEDLPLPEARALLGPDRILGATAHTVEEALRAQAEGADYLGVGAMFPTGTKTDTVPTSADTLKAICAAVSIPVVAIGGVNAQNLPTLAGTGIAGAAVVSAIFSQRDLTDAARTLRTAADLAAR